MYDQVNSLYSGQDPNAAAATQYIDTYRGQRFGEGAPGSEAALEQAPELSMDEHAAAFAKQQGISVEQAKSALGQTDQYNQAFVAAHPELRAHDSGGLDFSGTGASLSELGTNVGRFGVMAGAAYLGAAGAGAMMGGGAAAGAGAGSVEGASASGIGGGGAGAGDFMGDYGAAAGSSSSGMSPETAAWLQDSTAGPGGPATLSSEASPDAMSAMYGGDTASAEGLGGNAAAPGPSSGGLSSLFDTAKSGANWANTGSSYLGGMSPAQLGLGLYDMYGKQKTGQAQLDAYNQTKNQIQNYYAPGSPEYEMMKQQMERQDAAAGRNSQWGTRSVDLAAKTAQMRMNAQIGLQGGQNALLNQGMTNQYSAPGSLATLYGYANKPTLANAPGATPESTATSRGLNNLYNWATT